MQIGLTRDSGYTAQTVKDAVVLQQSLCIARGLQRQRGFSARKLAGCGRRCMQCFAWAMPGAVSIQWCFPEACIPNFGHVCINVSCTRSLNTVHFKYGEIFAHLFFCLCPLSPQLSVWVLKTDPVYDRKNTNSFIPAVLEGRPGAEKFPTHCCRFKRFRYISDKQPHLGVNHTCLELQSLTYSWRDCHLLSDEI